ncbi:hypothetical protein ACFQZO_23550 [Bradyrhizobium sp. GCM10027634]|uniref:hypothetical protein n=1 Tax=unclassified Bradyrhizobium TaxID=2631580 RepID=UPI00263B9D39|nr:hypothetical protein [Bradyrhizobium sp. WYCCWR 12677]MDN5003816.1 hypothetical protein [Bradyrhizobium sp. WYCCWR 12677]
MSAPLRHPVIEAECLDIADFVECCGYQLRHMKMGLIDRQTAVDGCQFLAEHGGFVAAFGQDMCQRELSRVFAPSIHAELEPQPAELRAYRTPQATVDAFFYVMRNETPAQLTAWLADHPRDAAHLHKLWKSHAVT